MNCPIVTVILRFLVTFAIAFPCFSQTPDIRGEEQRNSQVMRYASELLDDIGPRLTGSVSLDWAVAWSKATLSTIGLQAVREESWGAFGKRWRERSTLLRMTAPDQAMLTARAAPWSAPTDGVVEADMIVVRGFSSPEDFEPWRGKLRGKIVLYSRAPAPPKFIPIESSLVKRWSDEELKAFATEPDHRQTDDGGLAARASAHFELMQKTGEFFAAEGAAAVLLPNGNIATGGSNGNAVHSDTNYTFGWYVYRSDAPKLPPTAIIAVEDFGRLSRLHARQVPVRLSLNVDTETAVAKSQVNVFAEIPGVDPHLQNEVVMIGAHLDSWPAAAGATDDGAGVLIAIEAMRILQALHVQPRRMIRLALWTGEEQGALGSRAYVREHIATVRLDSSEGQRALPEFMRRKMGTAVPKPEQARLSAVYTLDAGGGKIRGISTGNEATVPLFEKWLAPLRDLGVTMIRAKSDCGGDCASFAQAGIPTPSFKQDPLTYNTQTHHTAADVYEQLRPDDLKQAAIVVATVLYETAMHDTMLPR